VRKLKAKDYAVAKSMLQRKAGTAWFRGHKIGLLNELEK
jgi:hypothetical protein